MADTPEDVGSTRAVDSVAAFLSPDAASGLESAPVHAQSFADELPKASRSAEILRALAGRSAHVSELSIELQLGLLDTAEAVRSLRDAGLITVDSASSDELISLSPEGTRLLPALGKEG